MSARQTGRTPQRAQPQARGKIHHCFYLQQWTLLSNIIVDDRASIIGPMGGKERRDGPSDQLRRLRDVVAQIERNGHPQWDDEFNRRPTQAGIAKRTKLKPAYLSALLGRGQARHSDIGAAILGLFASGVNVDIRYFYMRYERELPFKDWLLGQKEQQGTSASEHGNTDSVALLRAEFRSEIAKQARQQARELAALRSELKKPKRPS